MKPEPLFVFFHIPKTGGQTVRRYVLRRYEKGAYFLLGPYRPDPERPKALTTLQSIANLNSMPREKRMRVRIAGGHIQAAVLPLLPGQPRCFTLLRDPVSRLLSLYYHAQRKERHSLRLELAGMTLEAFAGSNLTRQLDNDQTRRLAGVSEPGIAGEFSEEPSAMLARARENLAKWFDFAGVTELFDESLLLWTETWKLRSPFYEKVNTASAAQRTEKPSEKALGLLRERNAQDLALHSELRERVQEEIRRRGRHWQGKVKRFRRINALYGPLIRKFDALADRFPFLYQFRPR